jgi:hypothetical protein
MRARLATLLGILALGAPGANAGPRVDYLYRLSDFSGTVPFGDARLYVDRARDEVYVGDASTIRIFDGSGMEVYSFGHDPELGSLRDLAVDENGDILILTYEYDDAAGGPRYGIARCDYRGRLRSRIAPAGLPEALADFKPDKMRYREGELYLVSSPDMRVVITDRDGAFVRSLDLATMIDLPPGERPATKLSGFNLDGSGNMLFTVPVLFAAFVVSPQGEVRSFGRVGSGPGMFGIVSDIVSDDRGNYLVADKLRSVVMIFDATFGFIQEFGYLTTRPDGLIRPSRLAVSGSGRLYVTQMRHNGISVFDLGSE